MGQGGKMGICYQGKTLKEAVEEKDRLLADTGYIYGVEKLGLAEEDPAKFMRFQMRMLAACITAKERAKLITASPPAMMMGELVFMLTTPEGDVVTASHGLVGHIQSVPYILRHITDLDFEEKPGIRQGDIFSSNEPYYGGTHGSDCFTFVPMFHEGELIAWAVGLNHILEVGALQPGNLSSLSPNAFTDGFLYPPMKTGEHFKQHRWWELLWQRRTRMGSMNILDDKMRVAGAVGLHDRLLEIVAEFGVDYFRSGLKQILERERRQLIQRIRTLTVPGTYAFLAFQPVRYKGWVGRMFPSSDRDWLVHLPEEFRILPDARMVLDCEGLTSEADFHCNCYESGIRMMDSLGWWPVIGYSEAINTAVAYLMDYNLPPGCMGNPQNPFAGTAMGLGILGKYCNMYYSCFSRSFFARGFLEESYVTQPACGGYGLDGVLADGFRWAGGSMTLLTAHSSGASAFKDGEPVLWSTPNPQSDMGELEKSEFMEPTNLTLGIKLVPNYCGHGRFRGGLGINICQMIDEPGQHLTAAVFTCASSETGPNVSGLSGGYPGLGTVQMFVHNTNMRELIEKGLPYPTDFTQIREWLKDGKLKAESVERYSGDTPNVEVWDGDLMVTSGHANCGWGDPLERQYDLVERDVHFGWITPDVAMTIYGTVTDDNRKVNASESNKLRQQMRNKRKERSVSARDWWEIERAQLVRQELQTDVYNMYADSLKYEKFRREFMDMWQLPQGYSL